jgi:hypothetical protein
MLKCKIYHRYPIFLNKINSKEPASYRMEMSQLETRTMQHHINIYNAHQEWRQNITNNIAI